MARRLVLASLLSAAALFSQSNALLVGPTALAFTYAGAGTQPPAQPLFVASGGAPLAFAASAVTASGGNWLSVSPATGTTPAGVAVAVSPAALLPGTYQGTVVLNATGAGNPTVGVAVVLTVRTRTQVAATPESLSFQYQRGGAIPPGQTITVSSNGAPLSTTADVQTFGGGDWLEVRPPFAATGTDQEVRVNPGDLAPGIYTGQITFTAAGASNSPVTVPVTLTVSSSPFLTMEGGPLTFAFQAGSALPPPQSLTVSATRGPVSFTAAATTAEGAWLRVSPASGAAPGLLSVSVDPSDLAAGTYTGLITLTAAGAANSPQRVSVTLHVTNSPIFTAAPAGLRFDAEVPGAPPAARTVVLSGGGNVLNYSVTVSTKTGGSWLAAGPLTGTTEGGLTVAVNAAGLKAGLYEGSVVIQGRGAANSPLALPVTLNVTTSPLLLPSPASLSFAFQRGATPPAAQTVTVTSSGAPHAFTLAAGAAIGGDWLHVGAPGGTTPGSFTVNVTPAGLADGVYSGAVTITSAGAGNSPVAIPVTLTVGSSALLVLSTGALRFTATGGPQRVSVGSTDGSPLSYIVLSNSAGNWLQATPRGGTTPGDVTVAVNAAGLAPGTYTGFLAVAAPPAANSPQTIAVTLVVAPVIAAAPSELAFQYQRGTPVPQPQRITVTGGAGLEFSAAAATQAGFGWLRVAPSSGTLPATVTVEAHPTSLAPGTYHGSVTVTVPHASNSPVVIPVRLTVAGGAVPAVSAVVNGASFQPTPVAPGLIATIFGSGLGPENGVTLRLAPDGRVDTTLADTRVLFDGVAAPMLYASQGQVSFVVPYSVAGRARSRIEVEYRGARSAGAEVQVAEAAPGIFPGAILNQDGSVNSAENPAPGGSVVMIYATGEGQTTPAGVDGAVTGATLQRPVLPVRVTIGGQEAEVLYAGSAPGLVAGVLQVNARVPALARRGSVPVVITVGAAASQGGVTLAVR